MSTDSNERLSSIEEKLNTLIAMLEGKHGAEGLAKQIYRNREDIASLKKLIYKASGVLGIIVPLVTYLIRKV